MGYDIGCAFSSTLLKANVQFTGDFTIPAMHGYCHNRLCQVVFQSFYKDGVGLSDFEQCERFFSASNLVALLTRHATSFNWQVFIDMQMEQNDREKLENLGKFIFYNYREALKRVREYQPIIDAAARRDPPQTAATFEQWLQEEHTYLKGLKKEPHEDTIRCVYIDCLHQFWEAQ
jgi:hypothetical protein